MCTLAATTQTHLKKLCVVLKRTIMCVSFLIYLVYACVILASTTDGIGVRKSLEFGYPVEHVQDDPSGKVAVVVDRKRLLFPGTKSAN